MKRAIHHQGERRAVLLLGNHRQSLTVIRSLHRAGWRVVVGVNGASDRNYSAHRSRYVSEVWQHPEWTHDPQAFAAALHQYGAANQLTALIPVNEAAMRHVAPFREELAKHVPIVMADASAITTCMDKSATMALCEQEDIPSAAYQEVKGTEAAQAACEALGLPCVVKPLDSTELVFGVKAAIVRDKEELSALLHNREMQDRHVIVQRFLDGSRHNVYVAADRGRLIAASHVVILRTDRVDGTGLAIAGVSTEPPLSLRQDTERFLKALNYTGIGCVQYMMDRSGSERSLLEFNVRFGGNYRIVEATGVPLTELAMDLWLGQTPKWAEDPWAFRRGVRYAWTCGALAGARFELRQGIIARRQAAGLIGRALFDAVRTPCHISWSWRDPVPTLSELIRPFTHRPTPESKISARARDLTQAPPVS